MICLSPFVVWKTSKNIQVIYLLVLGKISVDILTNEKP